MRLSDGDRWRDYAGCADVRTEVFFEDIWPLQDDDTVDPKYAAKPDPEALGAARNICRNCPVRVSCHAAEMEAEDGKAVSLRYGLRALLTPEQRHSLEKRRWRCRCGAVLDPADLIAGRRRCPRSCGAAETAFPPLADTGDEWGRRHTDAARKVLAHMEEHVAVGAEMPTTRELVVLLGVRRADLDRVYAAFIIDGELEKVGRRHRRVRDQLGALASCYLPSHLRHAD